MKEMTPRPTVAHRQTVAHTTQRASREASPSQNTYAHVGGHATGYKIVRAALRLS